MRDVNKKGQMTIMIVLGLLLMIVVGIFFGLSRISFSEQTEEQTGQSLTRGSEVEPVREYFQSCLSTVAREGLTLLGRQGGVLYRSQGGTVQDFREEQRGSLFVEMDQSRIAYGIHPPRFPAPPYSHRIPEYPYARFPYALWPNKAVVDEGAFGLNTLPPLRSSEGPVSLGSQLESYVSSNLPQCLDLRTFENDGFSFEAEEPQTEVTFTDASVSFSVDYPVEISLPATDEVISFSDFSAEHPVRLQIIHRFASSLVRSEIGNVSSDPAAFAPSGSPLSVSLRRDVWGRDDVIRVHDGESTLSGQPYEFRFARHNRPPALYYLSPESIGLETDSEVNRSILLPSYLDDYSAADPDEDSVTFSFVVESKVSKPVLPVTLDVDRMEVKIAVSDGELEDYQMITINNLGVLDPSFCPIEPAGCYDTSMNLQGTGAFSTGDSIQYLPSQFCTQDPDCECTSDFALSQTQVEDDGDDSANACGCFESSEWGDTLGCCGDDADDCGLIESDGQDDHLCYMTSANLFAEWREAGDFRYDVAELSCNGHGYLSDGQEWTECEPGTSKVLSVGGHDYLCRGVTDDDQWAECCGDESCNAINGMGIRWHRSGLGDQMGVNTIDAYDGSVYRCQKDETFVEI